jgi:hypothetical protein
MVDAHGIVGGDRPVEEAEPLAPAVLLAELVEDPLPLPPGEDLLLEGCVIGNGWERFVRYEAILRVEYAAAGCRSIP